MRFNRLECVERQVRAAHDGTEIIRTFFCDPYDAHPYVLSALLGGIDKDGDGNFTVRRKPAQDPYWLDCYCTDAWIDQTAKETMANSPSLMRQAAVNPGDDMAIDGVRDILRKKEVPCGPRVPLSDGVTFSDAGCFIRAVFKPLITCDLPTWKAHEGDKEADFPDWPGYDGLTPEQVGSLDYFDFVDPQFHPITKTANAGAGLKYTVGQMVNSNVGSEGFIVQPMYQFTIRRLMVPALPARTLDLLKGKVNLYNFHLGSIMFPRETLRLDDVEVIKRGVPYYDGTLSVWYDLLYVFTYNSIVDEAWVNAVKNGEIVGGDYSDNNVYVGWNRIFGVPVTLIYGIPVIDIRGGKIDQAHLSYYPMGWKTHVASGYRSLYLWDKNYQNLGDIFCPANYLGGTKDGFQDLFLLGTP